MSSETVFLYLRTWLSVSYTAHLVLLVIVQVAVVGRVARRLVEVVKRAFQQQVWLSLVMSPSTSRWSGWRHRAARWRKDIEKCTHKSVFSSQASKPDRAFCFHASQGLDPGCPNYTTKGRVAEGMCSNQSSAHSLTNQLSGRSVRLIKWDQAGVLLLGCNKIQPPHGPLRNSLEISGLD